MQLPKLKKVSEVKKKKILLLSDDLRMSSGVGTMSREIVMGTLDEYDWVQVGGAIKHPDNGKIIDMNDSVRKETGVENASLKIYPVDGYGNPNLLRPTPGGGADPSFAISSGFGFCVTRPSSGTFSFAVPNLGSSPSANPL